MKLLCGRRYLVVAREIVAGNWARRGAFDGTTVPAAGPTRRPLGCLGTSAAARHHAVHDHLHRQLKPQDLWRQARPGLRDCFGADRALLAVRRRYAVARSPSRPIPRRCGRPVSAHAPARGRPRRASRNDTCAHFSKRDSAPTCRGRSGHEGSDAKTENSTGRSVLGPLGQKFRTGCTCRPFQP